MTTVPPGHGGSPPPPPVPEGGTPAPEGFLAVAAVLVALALAFGLTAIVVGERQGGGPAVEGGGPTNTVAVELGDLFVEPDHIEVPTGTRLLVEATNTGELVHTLNLEGDIGTDRLQPGDSETVDFGVIDADAEAWCTVPGHREAGMLLTIAATAAPPEPPGPESPEGSGPPGPTQPAGSP